MPSLPLKTLKIPTQRRCQMIDLTLQIRGLLSDVKGQDGMVIVYVPHTTAGITINENADPDVQSDWLEKLGQLIPHREVYYRHGEGNSDSHLKASLVGSSVTVLLERGQLILGRWQGIYFCEFDGPRQRDLLVKLTTF